MSQSLFYDGIVPGVHQTSLLQLQILIFVVFFTHDKSTSPGCPTRRFIWRNILPPKYLSISVRLIVTTVSWNNLRVFTGVDPRCLQSYAVRRLEAILLPLPSLEAVSHSKGKRVLRISPLIHLPRRPLALGGEGPPVVTRSLGAV